MNASTFFKQFLRTALSYFALSVVTQLVRRLLFPTVDAWTWFDIQVAIGVVLVIAWTVVQRRRTRN